jgi:hypothetical protein
MNIASAITYGLICIQLCAGNKRSRRNQWKGLPDTATIRGNGLFIWMAQE